MTAIGCIEGPLDAPLPWNRITWETVRRNVSRLQARIVKAVREHDRVLSGALSRLEPCAVKVASTVLRGRGGGNVALLPDVVRIDAEGVLGWDAEEVLRRWTQLFAGPLLVQRFLSD